ncbi:MAG: hypothetical protein QG656_1618 [Candidatus Hydrogenedentes bacterium]|nr:hypothetical protein [Candidatus Hydrogenedentota bacterium]
MSSGDTDNPSAAETAAGDLVRGESKRTQPLRWPERWAQCAFVCGTVSYVFFHVLLFVRPLKHLDSPVAVISLAVGWLCATIGIVAGLAFFVGYWSSHLRRPERENCELVEEKFLPVRLLAWGLAISLFGFLYREQGELDYLINAPIDTYWLRFFDLPDMEFLALALLTGWLCATAGLFGSIPLFVLGKRQLGRKARRHMAFIGILAGTLALLLSGRMAMQPWYDEQHGIRDSFGSVTGNLRSIVAAQIEYRTLKGEFARDLQALRESDPPCYNCQGDVLNGYRYQVEGDGLTFTVHATPEEPRYKGSIYAFADETGVVRWEKGKPASARSPALGE